LFAAEDFKRLMQIGRLNRRVTVQQRTAASPDSFGAADATWTDIATIDAAVQPLRGQERSAARQTEAGADIKVTMRYRTIDAKNYRLKYGARLLDIESVIDIDERHRVLEVNCKEVV